MRIVLDTNILSRALFSPNGPAVAALQLSAEPPHTLLLGDGLLQELGRILGYRRVRPLHGLSDKEIDEHLQDLRAMAEIVKAVSSETPVVPDDPDDDHVIDVAISGRADVICTLDKHLRHSDVQAYCALHNIHIIGDVELLDVLRQGETDD